MGTNHLANNYPGCTLLYVLVNEEPLQRFVWFMNEKGDYRSFRRSCCYVHKS